MRHLPFRDAQFRAIWSMASLLHLPRDDAPAALLEMRRVLVPGGYLVLSVQHGQGQIWERDPYGAGVERFFARYSATEAEAFLAGTGFAVLDLTSDHRWLLVLASASTSPNRQ